MSAPLSPEPADESAEAAGQADPGDTRARFREALERKKNRAAGGFGAGSVDSRAGSARGAAGAKRVFRRKSG